MDEKQFKKNNKPAACTKAPWEPLVTGSNKFDILAKIRQESIEEYGTSFEECPKRKVCFSKSCIGRPLPWKSKTAQPYLEQLKTTHKIVSGELFLTSCDSCPIAKSCTSVCSEMNDYLSRDKSEEPQLVFKETIDNLEIEEPREISVESIFGKGFKIPWDVLTQKRQDTVKKYLYEHKDFLAIAKELGYYDQAKARYEFYAALTTLSRYGVMRKFMEDNANNGIIDRRDFSILNDIFFINKTLTDVAHNWSMSKQAVHQLVQKYKRKHNLKFQVFVKKFGNKVIFTVPEMMK